MKLAPEQFRQFEEDGYFFLPGCFSDEEVAVLRDEAEEIYKSDRQEVWREKTGAPRTAFAVARHFASLDRICDWSNHWSKSSAKGFTRTSSRSIRRRRSRATSGNDTRITAPGRATTACPSRAR